MAKTTLQGTVKGGKENKADRRRSGKTTSGNGQEFGKPQRAVGEQGKMEKTGCKIICGAPTTLAVKGLMIMMISILSTVGTYQR